MDKAWTWLIGALAAVGAIVLAFLGLRARHRADIELAEQAVELARKDAERERRDAKATVERETEAGRASAATALEAIDADVDKEARVGDLADAINRLRGGG